MSYADKERCKVKIGDDYRLIDRTYTKGGCMVEAKKYAAPRLCREGDKRFDFKYMFDAHIYEGDGLCSGSASSSSSSSSASSSGKSRCKVREGDDWHYLDRTHTKGGCRVDAKAYIGPKLCEDGGKRFTFTYSFDGDSFDDEGSCSLVK